MRRMRVVSVMVLVSVVVTAFDVPVDNDFFKNQIVRNELASHPRGFEQLYKFIEASEENFCQEVAALTTLKALLSEEGTIDQACYDCFKQKIAAIRHTERAALIDCFPATTFPAMEQWRMQTPVDKIIEEEDAYYNLITEALKMNPLVILSIVEMTRSRIAAANTTRHIMRINSR